jgi:hypothetical protein
MRWLGRALAFFGFLILAADHIAAQTTTGTIRGYVRDQNGAPLAGASSGLPGVARMSGADPERPQCHTVPSPR